MVPGQRLRLSRKLVSCGRHRLWQIGHGLPLFTPFALLMLRDNLVQANRSFRAIKYGRTNLLHEFGAKNRISHLSITALIFREDIRRQIIAASVPRTGITVNFDTHFLAQGRISHVRGRYCTSRIPEL